MSINNNERKYFNCLSEILKAYYDFYGMPEQNFQIRVNSYSGVFFTSRTNLDWRFLEKVKEVTDKYSTGWSVNISTNQNLYIEIN